MVELATGVNAGGGVASRALAWISSRGRGREVDTATKLGTVSANEVRPAEQGALYRDPRAQAIARLARDWEFCETSRDRVAIMGRLMTSIKAVEADVGRAEAQLSSAGHSFSKAETPAQFSHRVGADPVLSRAIEQAHAIRFAIDWTAVSRVAGISFQPSPRRTDFKSAYAQMGEAGDPIKQRLTADDIKSISNGNDRASMDAWVSLQGTVRSFMVDRETYQNKVSEFGPSYDSDGLFALGGLQQGIDRLKGADLIVSRADKSGNLAMQHHTRRLRKLVAQACVNYASIVRSHAGLANKIDSKLSDDARHLLSTVGFDRSLVKPTYSVGLARDLAKVTEKFTQAATDYERSEAATLLCSIASSCRTLITRSENMMADIVRTVPEHERKARLDDLAKTDSNFKKGCELRFAVRDIPWAGISAMAGSAWAPDKKMTDMDAVCKQLSDAANMTAFKQQHANDPVQKSIAAASAAPVTVLRTQVRERSR